MTTESRMSVWICKGCGEQLESAGLLHLHSDDFAPAEEVEVIPAAELDEAIEGCERLTREREEARQGEDEFKAELLALSDAAASVLGQRVNIATGSYLPDNPVVRGKLDHLSVALTAAFSFKEDKPHG